MNGKQTLTPPLSELVEAVKNLNYPTYSAPNTGYLPLLTPTWAVVEVMGHRSHYGQIEEIELLGVKMLRIDTMTLPELPEERTEEYRQRYDSTVGNYVDAPGFEVKESSPAVPSQTIIYPVNAIFSIRLLTEEEVREESERLRPYRRTGWQWADGSDASPHKVAGRTRRVPEIDYAPANAGEYEFDGGDDDE